METSITNEIKNKKDFLKKKTNRKNKNKNKSKNVENTEKVENIQKVENVQNVQKVENKKENKFNKNKTQNPKIKQYTKSDTTIIIDTNNKLTQIEVLYKKARTLYEDATIYFDLERPDIKNRESKWTADILRSGTLEDKVSSLAIYIKNNPRHTLKYLDMLTKMAKKKNRRQTEMCIMALKDLFLETILTNKKLTSFLNGVSQLIENNNQNGENNNSTNFSNEVLLKLFVDDYIHKKYSELLEIIGDIIVNDPLKAMKKKYLNILLEMINKRPEKEERILEILINKLGDPEVEVTNFTIKILKDLQSSHPKMSLVILKNVQNFMSKLGDENHKKFYSLVFLSQMNLINDTEFLEYSLEFFFDLFNFYSILNDEESKNKKYRKNIPTERINSTKFLSLIVKRINMICKFASEKNASIKKLLDEKINILFKLSHSESVKLRIEVLKLIFMICQGVLSGESKKFNNSDNGSSYTDRYYRSLYEVLLVKEIIFSKHLRELLKLIMMSLSFDTNLCRVASFLKRLLEVCLYAEPSFISCILIITSQVLRNKHKLWKMVDKNTFAKVLIENDEDDEGEEEEKGEKGGYKNKNNNNNNNFDYIKRDPSYTHADLFPVNELILLTQHYHPTIQRFSQFILQNYNKDIISYEGDPLVDFSLLNFLDKFMLKNPKIKKDKRVKSKLNKEEEDLKKFMGEDEEDENNNNEEINENENNETNTKNNFELDFIKKFNEIEKVKSVKYEKMQERKKKKKLSIPENLEEGDMDEDEIERYADKVMDDEYEKYDKDIDDDEAFEDVSEISGDEENIEENDEADFEDGVFEEAELDE